MHSWFPLAQTTAPVGGAPATGTPGPEVPAGGGAASTQQSGSPAPQNTGTGSGFGQIAIMLVAMLALLYFMTRGPRKEEKQRKAMIEQMKRGDEVLLISGKLGKIVDIREDRVVVKVDEANNVKETYLKTAVQRVMTAGTEEKK